MRLKEKVILAREQEELKAVNDAMEPSEAIDTFKKDHGEDLEELDATVGYMNELDENIEQIDDNLEKIESNTNPTEADVIAAEMILNSVRYNCGLTNVRLGTESFKNKVLNPKKDMKRLATEYRKTKEELYLAREGFIKDIFDKVKNVITGFKNTISNSAKKLLATLTGRKGDFEFKKDVMVVPDLGVEAIQKKLEFDVAKASLFELIFNKSKTKYDLTNIKSAKKIPYTKAYVQDLYNFIDGITYFGLKIYDLIEENAPDAKRNEVLYSYLMFIEGHSDSLSSKYGEKLEFLKSKGQVVQGNSVKSYIESSVKSVNKMVTKENLKEACDAVETHDKMVDQLRSLLSLGDALDTIVGDGAKDKIDDNLRGLNKGLAIDDKVARYVICHINATLLLTEKAMTALDSSNDVYEAARKIGK